MGFGDFLDSVGDSLESGFDTVKAGVGSVLDAEAHLVGDGLDLVGLHGAAHAVDSFGDSVADSLGAQIGEAQLGESEDPEDLVHGDVGAIGTSVGHLRKFSAAFESTGEGLTRLDHDHWQGQAADAFRAKFAPHPKLWLTAADACRTAADALEQYAQTVQWAQQQAQQAVDAYRAAKQASEQARDAYNQDVDRYNRQARAWNEEAGAGNDPGPAPTRPAAFSDPGEAGLKEAQELLRTARQQRDSAGEAAKAAVDAATATAPAEPSFLERMGKDLSDAFQGSMVGQLHLAGGIVKGAADIVKFARGLNSMDPYNTTHPAQYADHVSTTAVGLLHAANHPTELLSAVVGSGWGSDPFEAGGKLITNLAFGAVTGGGGEAAAVAERAGLTVAEDAAENAARNVAEDAGQNAARNAAEETAENAARQDASVAARDAAEDAPKEARAPEEVKTCGDPVDVATGQMVLRHTDLSLAGSLPLLFERAHTSAHRSGRWLGPSWASSLDERLVIDAEGVLLLRADCGLLSYPHPVPGVPTMPVAGTTRWPLARDAEGAYTVVDPRAGLTRTYLPEPEDPSIALLTEVRDRNGRWIAYDYDDAGAPVAIRHHAGHRVEVDVADGRITALRLADAGPDGAEIVRFAYTDGHLTGVRNSSGLAQRFAYDQRGRITAWLDRNDRRYDYAYDHLDRCTDQGAPGGELRYHYDYAPRDPATGHRTTAATDSLGHTTRYLVDEQSRVVAETDPLGHTTRYAFDRHGRPATVTDPMGRVTAYTYDERGNVTTVIRPDGAQILAVHNELDLPTVVVDADGSTWRHSYDERGNMTVSVDPEGGTTRYAYDGLGHLVAVTDPLGAVTRVVRDEAGRLLRVTDPLGASVSYTRDAFGRAVASEDPVGGVTRYRWTVEGRLAERVTPAGGREQWRYDGEGNVVEHVGAAGGVTRFAYSHFDQLAARTGPEGSRVEFGYDTELRLVRVTNAEGLTWDYVRDAAGRVVSESDFNGRTLAYRRDACGRVTVRTDGAGGTVRYEHDALSRVVRRLVDGAATGFEWDRAGRMVRAVGPDVELTREYDRLGRITAEVCDGRRIESAYDGAGRRVRRVTPSGVASHWQYDAAGNRTALSSLGGRIDFGYDRAGRETERTPGPDRRVTVASRWDADHRLAWRGLLRAQDPAEPVPAKPFHGRSYTYRPDGLLTAVDDHLSGRQDIALDLDGRITAVTGQEWSERYVYDTAGPIAEAHWPESAGTEGTTGTRAYAGTRVVRAGRVRYEYDAQGRITLRQKTRLSKKPDTWRFSWDAEDRLTGVVTPDGASWAYRYDPLGRRVAKLRLEADGSIAEETRFTWDGFNLAEQRSREAGSPDLHVLTWQHKGTHPVAQIEQVVRGGGPAAVDQAAVDHRFFAIVTDLVGAPTELLDASGAIAWRSRRTAWGSTTWPRKSATYTPLRFPGQYFDPETRLHYNVHRYYDPESGRYASADPLGAAPGPDNYAYVANPTGWIDPLGLTPCREAAKQQALRDAGVPEGAEPLEERLVPATTPRGKQILDANHQPVYFKEEVYLNADDELVVFQDHHTGHLYGEGGVGDQPPHVHVRPFDDPRNGQMPPPAQEHYYYDPDLG
ncbi:putative T7SS-secreted protein [Kitasatospora sp. NPDC049285]|uniref:putative T7SS-secreted protein n=1 Tax=Kitasatospora sp. NPDC049285 TaxID=3157096 RepID=UPI00343F49E1